MARPFIPLVANAHVLTVLGNFWPRKLDFSPYAYESKYYRTEPDVQVLVQTHKPSNPIGELVMIHGLEGAGSAGYIRTLANTALRHGFIAHRFHMRTCGGTEHLCNTLYHAGLTSDLLSFLQALRPERPTLPIFLAGFSLGGNVALKLAGELGESGPALLAGVCSVSTPIDLAACARRIGEPDNRLYENRFLKRMRERLFATGRYTREQLAAPKSLYAIDDKITAPSFGFGTADNYYATQSANRFLDNIRIPALMIQAQDDTFIPFSSYNHPAFARNKCLRLIAPEHGGHVGFLARRPPRFWADETIIEWLLNVAK
ncbi:MAG: alpha/beta hydrolase fold [Bryobacterales bacterium]|nr:alpha/beta hydrolase fold [Bryobacterales bacterium]